MLILALIIPSIILIIVGIIIVGCQLPGDFSYLILLFALLIPAEVILFLTVTRSQNIEWGKPNTELAKSPTCHDNNYWILHLP